MQYIVLVSALDHIVLNALRHQGTGMYRVESDSPCLLYSQYVTMQLKGMHADTELYHKSLQPVRPRRAGICSFAVLIIQFQARMWQCCA